MSEQPTRDEVMRVRRFECQTHGHPWDVISTFGGGPTRIVCTNCGETHRVEQGQSTSLTFEQPGTVAVDAESRKCSNCERCTWNPGPDCGLAEHEHCGKCGHCCGRHAGRDESW